MVSIHIRRYIRPWPALVRFNTSVISGMINSDTNLLFVIRLFLPVIISDQSSKTEGVLNPTKSLAARYQKRAVSKSGLEI